MAKKHSTAVRKGAPGAAPKSNPSIDYGRFPETVDLKITCAKNIMQAVLGAQDYMDGKNYDIHWPLSIAVRLLEDARSQHEREQMVSRKETQP